MEKDLKFPRTTENSVSLDLIPFRSYSLSETLDLIPFFDSWLGDGA